MLRRLVPIVVVCAALAFGSCSDDRESQMKGTENNRPVETKGLDDAAGTETGSQPPATSTTP